MPLVTPKTPKPAPTTVKKPQPLTRGEWVLACLLLLAGMAVIAVALLAYSGVDSNLVFKQKEKTVVEVRAPSRNAIHQPTPPKKVNCGTKKTKKERKACRKKQRQRERERKRHEREGERIRNAGGGRQARVSAGTKIVHEVEYSDSVAIAALTIGLALAVSGGLYGRIRSLKVPGFEAKFVDSEAENATLEVTAQKLEEKIVEAPVTGDTQAAFQTAAQAVAIAEVNKLAAYGIEPTESVIEDVANRAAEEVTKDLD